MISRTKLPRRKGQPQKTSTARRTQVSPGVLFFRAIRHTKIRLWRRKNTLESLQLSPENYEDQYVDESSKAPDISLCKRHIPALSEPR